MLPYLAYVSRVIECFDNFRKAHSRVYGIAMFSDMFFETACSRARPSFAVFDANRL